MSKSFHSGSGVHISAHLPRHMNPRGAQVGVYLGCCGSEVHALWLGDINNITGYEQTGCTMSMFANRLSFTYDFKGPSKAVDTGVYPQSMAKTWCKALAFYTADCRALLTCPVMSSM